MHFAVPRAEGRLCSHFGHCEQFAMVDTDPATKQVLRTERVTPPLHVPGVPPEWLHAQGVRIVLAGGMGSRAREMLVARGITVIAGAPEWEPEALAQAYLTGTLVTGENTCDL